MKKGYVGRFPIFSESLNLAGLEAVSEDDTNLGEDFDPDDDMFELVVGSDKEKSHQAHRRLRW
jgi:hypothetical protein